MDDFRSLTVKDLQAKCKEAGLSCSARKNQLIERLEGTCKNDVNQRIALMEKTIAELREQSAHFQASDLSSTSHTFESPLVSPLRVSPNTASIAVPSAALVGNRTSAISPITTYAQQHVSSQPPLPQQMAAPSYVCQKPICAPYTLPYVPSQQASYNLADQGAQQTGAYNVNYTQPQIPISDYAQASRASQGIPQTTHIPIQQSYSSFAPPVQNNVFATNPYGNIREILTILPTFNPSSDESLSSMQFIKRVETLKAAYGWDDHSLVFAVQQRMYGPAKYWVDSLQTVFSSWQQFVYKFLQDFP